MYCPCKHCSWILCNTKIWELLSNLPGASNLCFRWNWANCYGARASVAQFLHDLCEEYHIHLFFWFVGNNNGRKKRPQYTQAARLNQQASMKEENSNTCGATKEKVGHWVVLSCCCCFWMKICPQTCAACCGRLCAVFILLMSVYTTRTKNHILFANKIFKSKKKSLQCLLKSLS